MECRKIAIVGAGVIGASWATLFLSKGLDVVATDPADGAEDRLRATISRQWAVATALGLADGASQSRLRFTNSIEDAVAEADFVQENGPERLDIKRDLYRRMDAATGPAIVLATSSSGILVSEIQAFCNRPERVLVGHPFNPPHIIPLVEIVGGAATDSAALDTASALYRSVGKRPIHLKKEVKGHVANRLQAALWREAFSLVQQGVASVADIDTAIAQGPGLRWALLGPFLNLALSGGAGGLRHALDHLGPPIEEWWRDLGNVTIDEALKVQLAAGAAEALAGRPIDDVAAERDAVLLALLKRKSEAALPS